ncbi:DUF3800 domain-containing protein [Empedobacter falsenii]|uniref:DUF3800 domain-containing protein n=1 Tax=Empedobacter falsenii TaxID=343874 RepID=UPI00257721C8|nr:DUF3800 domain-containing protein [Empedobacter falsenii]MDM1063617.1 DUF3800 domain-containing protein [Empedobacter falsenii]
MEKIIYIDESCHLENDDLSLMCIGYTKIDAENYNLYKEEIKAIKLKHHTPTEIKWNKLSMSRIALYKELIDYFFQRQIQFRAILVKNKKQLDHQRFNKGDHSSFYYTLVFFLLRNPFINFSQDNFKVILDIKDTRGKERLRNLDIRLKNEYKFKYQQESPFHFFQHIRSEENVFLQLTDLFIGAITYKARKVHENEDAALVKKEIVAYIEEKSGYVLDDGTNPLEEKFNIFDFSIQSNNLQ